jgi:hypothetical protein
MTKSNDNVGEVKMMMCEKGEWGSYVAPAPHWLMGDSSHPFNYFHSDWFSLEVVT